MASVQAKTVWERMRKGKKKFIAPINSYPTRNRKFQRNWKKSSKNLKIKKHHYGFFSSQNKLAKAEKKRK